MSLIRAAVGVFASGAVTFGGLGVVTVGAAQTVTTPQRPPTCVSTGAVRGLSAIQAQNARIIVATAEQRAGRAGAYIAIMVALAESDLRILSNPNDPAGASIPSSHVAISSSAPAPVLAAWPSPISCRDLPGALP